MRPKPAKLDKKHPQTARDAMEEIRDISSDAKAVQNNIRYMEPNRDRALGEADRTGRHFDEVVNAEAMSGEPEEEREPD